MQTLQVQKTHFRKIVRLPNGVLALVLFELTPRNGRLIAKAVSYEVIPEKIEETESLFLPCCTLKAQYITEKKSVISPYLSFVRDLSFLVKQSPRAPSFC